MSHLEEKEEKNSIELISYASGDGSLSLAFQSKFNKNISTVKVTRRDVDAYVKRADLLGWDILYNGHNYKLHRPVERITNDEVKLGGQAYRYVKIHEQAFHIFNEEDQEVVNLNIKGAVMFFVNNEELIKQQGFI